MGDSNAERQKRFAEKAKAAGKMRIHAWVDQKAVAQLKKTAKKEGVAIGDLLTQLVLEPPAPPEPPAPTGSSPASDAARAFEPSASPGSTAHATENNALVGEATGQANPVMPEVTFHPREHPAPEPPRSLAPPKLTIPGRGAPEKKETKIGWFFPLFVVTAILFGVAAWRQTIKEPAVDSDSAPAEGAALAPGNTPQSLPPSIAEVLSGNGDDDGPPLRLSLSRSLGQ